MTTRTENRSQATFEEAAWALAWLVRELEEYDVPQTDEQGRFGSETCLGEAIAALKAVGLYQRVS